MSVKLPDVGSYAATDCSAPSMSTRPSGKSVALSYSRSMGPVLVDLPVPGSYNSADFR